MVHNPTHPPLAERIRLAVHDLIAKGMPVSQRAVREIAGGSFRDISRLLSGIEQEVREEIITIAKGPETPDSITRSLNEAWLTAWKLAHASFDEDRADLSRQLTDAQASAEEAWAAVTEVEKERDDAEAECTQLQALLKDCRADLAAAQALCAGRDKELVEAKVRLEEREATLVHLKLRGVPMPKTRKKAAKDDLPDTLHLPFPPAETPQQPSTH